MAYGFTFEDIKKVNEPVPIKRKWGHYIKISNKLYGLEKIYLKKGGKQPPQYPKRKGTFFVEEGSVLLKFKKNNFKLKAGDTFLINPIVAYSFVGLKKSHIYFFHSISNSHEENENKQFRIGKTTDFRKKYWGNIQTIVNKDYCGKRIYMKKNAQNSLEFHCKKYETYFVHSGKVEICLRVGRGENKSIILKTNEAFNIPPGLMHMKISSENCVILEASTKDDDRDSYLVEDGRKYVHREY